MEGIENAGWEIHPGTFRFGSRLIGDIDPRSPPRTMADIATGSDP
jgi:hypothetical protein